MENCVFCKIVRGKIPTHKILEDNSFVAFLGIFPKFPGMTVVATKKHTENSYLYQLLTDEELKNMHIFTKKVALLLDKALGSMRCIQVMEGLEAVHAHLKLFPLYEGKNYGVHFEGEIKAKDIELQKIADKILGEVVT